MLHSFVDESKRDSFLLVAAMIRSAHLASLRQSINAMVMPGQRRIHFNSERDSRRSQIMARLADLPIEAIVYEVAGKATDRAVRDRCVRLMIRDQVKRDVRRLIIEREDSRAEVDGKAISAEVQVANAGDHFHFDQVRGYEEPLLMIPDAIAWCWPKGGHWRVKAKQLVKEVIVEA